jgi:hypothetical protein
MPERSDAGEETVPVAERIKRAEPGLAALLAEAEQTWRGRSELPGWRPFEDAFPTFYQFTNRPR